MLTILLQTTPTNGIMSFFAFDFNCSHHVFFHDSPASKKTKS